MKPEWTKGLNETQSKELGAEFLGAVLVREALAKMLHQRVETSLAKMRAFAHVMPNLSEAYAAELSKQQTLLDIVKLIK
jgi:hypothetical protein